MGGGVAFLRPAVMRPGNHFTVLHQDRSNGNVTGDPGKSRFLERNAHELVTDLHVFYSNLPGSSPPPDTEPPEFDELADIERAL